MIGGQKLQRETIFDRGNSEEDTFVGKTSIIPFAYSTLSNFHKPFELHDELKAPAPPSPPVSTSSIQLLSQP